VKVVEMGNFAQLKNEVYRHVEEKIRYNNKL
jgi:hypothetical protein